MAGERFNREAGKPRLAEAPPADSAVDTEVEASELLTRLEHQAAESGRLEGQTQTLERALKAERDGSAAARGHAQARAQSRQGTPRSRRARPCRARTAEQDLERVRQGFALSEQQLQVSWARLMQAEQELALRTRPLWRKLLRRPPGD